ncbi:MAG: DHH family phosphoesterase, partial [Candidatus Latescibacterota bacterium]
MAHYPENIPYWEKIRQLLDGEGKVFLSTHINPDGDDVGSVMALAGFLKKMGKLRRVILQSVLPESYRFLDPDGLVESYPEYPPSEGAPGEGDLVFFLDLGRLDRSGIVEDFLVRNRAKKIIIDHHRPE